jgi:hypothetical protein
MSQPLKFIEIGVQGKLTWPHGSVDGVLSPISSEWIVTHFRLFSHTTVLTEQTEIGL